MGKFCRLRVFGNSMAKDLQASRHANLKPGDSLDSCKCCVESSREFKCRPKVSIKTFMVISDSFSAAYWLFYPLGCVIIFSKVFKNWNLITISRGFGNCTCF